MIMSFNMNKIHMIIHIIGHFMAPNKIGQFVAPNKWTTEEPK